MKRCPQCNRTYSDDALSFCLDDGSPLLSASAPSSFDPSATVQYPQGRETSPPPTIAFPAGAAPPPPPPGGQQPPPQWSPMPPAQPQKRSVWPWLLGIGAVFVFLGIGLVILIFVIAKVTNDNSNRVANTNTNSNRNANRNTNTNGNRNTNSNSNSNSNTRSSLTSFTDDFSSKTWQEGLSQYGRIWYSNEEYHMTSSSGKYIVRYAPDTSQYQTENATVRVGVRSIDGNVSSTGYGLVVHGFTTKDGQFEDYAFLLSNADSKKYRIVLHKNGKETILVDLTSSTTIRSGTEPNQLEVRIRDQKMDFYINGQFVTSIVDEANFRKGVVGFYDSGPGEVAFDDLEISK
jgi:cytoskeletal protein RodZ